MADFLPYGRQLIEDDDIAAVAEALAGDYLTTGPKVEEFEAKFAEVVGAAHAVACNSGTSALHLAMAGAGIGEGDLVAVPSITFLASANAVRMCGAEVVFTDVDPATGLMTPETLEAAARRAGGPLKGACVVHMAGRMADIQALHAVFPSRDVLFLADACHALGSTLSGLTPVQQVEAACYSFHPVKTITTAEGGMVATNSAQVAERARLLRSHGMVRSPHDPAIYDMVEPGWNYRIPDVLCALGISQLSKLERFSARRRALAKAYDERLSGLSQHLATPPKTPGEPVLHLYTVAIDFAALGIERGAVMARLREAGIGTQVHYIPVHTQPYYAARYGQVSLPGAQEWCEKTLSLPLFPGMEISDVDRVAGALEQALKP